MTRQELHREVIRRLLLLRGDCAERVRLVARLYNDEMLGGDSTSRVFFFLPDLHLLSRAGDADYGYSFLKLDAGRRVGRDVLLDRLCQTVLDFWDALPRGTSVRAVLLGDFIDLWREEERERDDVTGLGARILDDNPMPRARLVRRGRQSLEPDVVLGNHDLKMGASTELRAARRSFALPVGRRRTLLATHGDLFDTLEILAPQALKEWFVERFGPLARPATRPLDRSGEPAIDPFNGPTGGPPITLESDDDENRLPDWVNVWTAAGPCDREVLEAGHRLLPDAVGCAAGVRSGDRRTLDRLDLPEALPDLRTVVIGHSHHAKVCVYHDAAAPENDLVLADCGAWVEWARFRDGVVPSCPFGILCGGDLRIYQLDVHPSLVTSG